VHESHAAQEEGEGDGLVLIEDVGPNPNAKEKGKRADDGNAIFVASS